jgi:hypothetical protein
VAVARLVLEVAVPEGWQSPPMCPYLALYLSRLALAVPAEPAAERTMGRTEVTAHSLERLPRRAAAAALGLIAQDRLLGRGILADVAAADRVVSRTEIVPADWVVPARRVLPADRVGKAKPALTQVTAAAEVASEASVKEEQTQAIRLVAPASRWIVQASEPRSWPPIISVVAAVAGLATAAAEDSAVAAVAAIAPAATLLRDLIILAEAVAVM